MHNKKLLVIIEPFKNIIVKVFQNYWLIVNFKQKMTRCKRLKQNKKLSTTMSKSISEAKMFI